MIDGVNLGLAVNNISDEVYFHPGIRDADAAKSTTGGSFAGNEAKTPLIEPKMASISEGLRHKFKRLHTTKVGSFASIENRLSALEQDFKSLEKSA